MLLLAKDQGNKVSAAISCYPANTGMLGDLSGISADVELHLAADDAFFPLDAGEELAKTLRKGGADVTVHVYPDTGHAFLNDENLLGTYDEEAANLLWKRMVDELASSVA